MLLQVNAERLEKLFPLFYGMLIAGVCDPVLLDVFKDLNDQALIHYGDDYNSVCAALNDDFQVLQPN